VALFDHLCRSGNRYGGDVQGAFSKWQGESDMNRKKLLTLYLISTLVLLAVLVGYRIYLFARETDYQALNAENRERIETRLHSKTSYKFAVIGNISNSMRIFERRIAPLIGESGAEFMISVGNAVYDGAEGKYRLLYRGLEKAEDSLRAFRRAQRD
jgi:hypothetical protein